MGQATRGGGAEERRGGGAEGRWGDGGMGCYDGAFCDGAEARQSRPAAVRLRSDQLQPERTTGGSCGTLEGVELDLVVVGIEQAIHLGSARRLPTGRPYSTVAMSAPILFRSSRLRLCNQPRTGSVPFSVR
jgi:hypothetical protein